MNAPNSSSNALSVRETTGLVEGNGVFADDTMKDDCVAYSPGLICRPPRPDSKIARKHLTNVVAASVCRGASATWLPVDYTATQRRGYRSESITWL
jgi:hypothetical protein